MRKKKNIHVLFYLRSIAEYTPGRHSGPRLKTFYLMNREKGPTDWKKQAVLKRTTTENLSPSRSPPHVEAGLIMLSSRLLLALVKVKVVCILITKNIVTNIEHHEYVALKKSK
ncbi:hypothetical protein CEXT_530661 [Caerostris extrusa]|uniref:Uncharacterized protein n=1 Tax=Caerostris extrusa TaxID=172846 RepID=A0AAV4N4Y9_CAEEX|nr:hypothetical protein CEXT_530661 [Caerostris extrusa]